MNNTLRILLYFVLPTLAPLLFPPDYLMVFGPIGIGLAVLLFVSLGWLLLRGRSTALTLSIFLQGLNVIIRLMMLFPHAYEQGTFNPVFVVTSLLSIGLSLYVLQRLDKVDVRATMVR
ncbi:MAG: hypothetical protein ACKOC5_15340 [Chloroflexota bacterium]